VVQSITTTAEHVVLSFAMQQCCCPLYGGNFKNTKYSIKYRILKYLFGWVLLKAEHLFVVGDNDLEKYWNLIQRCM
jgi:hypothetical protein